VTPDLRSDTSTDHKVAQIDLVYTTTALQQSMIIGAEGQRHVDRSVNRGATLRVATRGVSFLKRDDYY